MSDPSGPEDVTVPSEELPLPGELSAVVVEGREIVIANVEGRVFAVEGLCTHADCDLIDGDLEEHHLICPCHGGTFDVRNGDPVDGPVHVPLRVYPVSTVEHGVSIDLRTGVDAQHPS